MQNDTSTGNLQLDSTSGEFVGQWNRLVSTTNWEKGKIILQWRNALIATDATASEYSDEAWASQVGRITGQHVGRLRRVAERFEESRTSFDGLYWSHFQAALDWEDAEMWLEGAMQNKWSVSQMKNQRWEAIGAPEDKKPNDADIITSEIDEDIEPVDAMETVEDLTEEVAEIQAYDSDDEESSDHLSSDAEDTNKSSNDSAEAISANQTAALSQPFADLPELPQDVQEAFDSFKLAILHHKVNKWEEISSADLVIALDALKTLVTAPAEESVS